MANIFVNYCRFLFIYFGKDGGCQTFGVVFGQLFYMFVFLTNEHIAANFASFAIVKFSVAADSIANFGVGNMLRHWGVTFIGNFIGGGSLDGSSICLPQ